VTGDPLEQRPGHSPIVLAADGFTDCTTVG
jgi:hypothetical protein